jgi:DNA polymerase-3 subunit epsilon
VVLDVETTGLDTAKDEIIELGMVKFTYLPSGEITHVTAIFEAFNEPSTSIPSEIVELTGITDELVAGHKISADDVSSFVADAAIIIAHNAAFDRRFSERYWPAFEHKNWACSATQVEWRKLGFEGSRLAYLLAGCGYFHQSHRAADDCKALLEIMSMKPNGSKNTVLALLLASARKPTVRIWAEQSPFDLREILKKRKYRWNDGSDGRPKAWYIDVPEANQANELTFLRDEIYQREIDLLVNRITAAQRFSNRV